MASSRLGTAGLVAFFAAPGAFLGFACAIAGLLRKVGPITIVRTRDDGSFAFEVQVKDTDGDSHHVVTLERNTYERLSGERYAPETCVEAAFRFLLDHESKELILTRFDVERISHYFPEFEQGSLNIFPGFDIQHATGGAIWRDNLEENGAAVMLAALYVLLGTSGSTPALAGRAQRHPQSRRDVGRREQNGI